MAALSGLILSFLTQPAADESTAVFSLHPASDLNLEGAGDPKWKPEIEMAGPEVEDENSTGKRRLSESLSDGHGMSECPSVACCVFRTTCPADKCHRIRACRAVK
jgi:hypothetical protein